MKKMLKILKWTAIAAGAVLLAVAAYVAVNSIDSEAPDVSRFVNKLDVPAEADNVYCALVAATNVISEKSGKLVLDDIFEKHKKAFDRYSQHKANESQKGMTAEEMDQILAEAAKPLALFHEAAQRRTWYAFDHASGKRLFFPTINRLFQLCRLAELEAMRHLERGETGAAIENVRDMLLLARKMENDSESGVRWLVANGGFLGLADNIATKIVRSGKATDGDLVRLQDALRQFELPNRLERAQRMLNNDFTVYFVQMAEKVDTTEIADFLKSMDNSTTLDACVARIFPLIKGYAFHRNRTWATYGNLLDKIKERYRLGYDKAEWEKLDEELQVACDTKNSWRYGPNFVGKKILGAIVPAWHGIANSIAKSSFQHSAVETIVAAARFKRKTGAYPKALAELVPEFMPAVPEDPYAKGKELKYDVSRGIIWTVGAEGSFNGETVKPRADGKYDSYGKYGRENRNYVRNIDGTPAK